MHLLFLPGRWDRAHVRSLDALAAVLMRGAGRGTLVGRSTDPCPDTPGGVSASKAFGSYFAKVVGKGYMEGVGRHNFCMPFPTEIPNHLIALKKH